MTIYHGSGFLDGYAVVEEKGMHAIEAYLLTRTLMYDDVYYHKTTRCIERLIRQIFQRIRDTSNNNKLDLPLELGFIENLDHVRPQDLLLLDDHTVYFLLERWARSNDDEILSDLSNRILNRKLLKCVEYKMERETYSRIFEKDSDIKKVVHDKTEFDPSYYCIIDEPEERPYDPILSPSDEEEKQESLRRNIFIKEQRANRVEEISKLSEVVDALTKKKQITRLYFPLEVRRYLDV